MTLRRLYRGLLLGVAGCSQALVAQAADLVAPAPRTAVVYATSVFDLSLSIGVLTARATETVYAARGDGSGLPSGARISNLLWTTQASGFAGLTLGWNATDRTRLEASFHAPFVNDSNRMTNTDWLSPAAFPDWTDRSLHPDTRGGRSYIGDLRLAHRFYQSGGFSAHALAGYRRTEMSWKAYGGTFVYTEASADDCASYGSRTPAFDASSDFRNCVGAFDPVAQITYRQTFNTPYLGLRGVFASGPWRLRADFIGTPFVWSSDRDLHVGETLFKSTFRQQTMLGGALQASYQFAPRYAFFVEADGQWYLNRKGSLEAWDVVTGEYFDYGSGSAGASLQTMRLSAGLKASF